MLSIGFGFWNISISSTETYTISFKIRIINLENENAIHDGMMQMQLSNHLHGTLTENGIIEENMIQHKNCKLLYELLWK